MMPWVIHKSAPILIESFGYVFLAALARASAVRLGPDAKWFSEDSGQSPQGALFLNGRRQLFGEAS